jgi:hypothetical protein
MFPAHPATVSLAPRKRGEENQPDHRHHRLHSTFLSYLLQQIQRFLPFNQSYLIAFIRLMIPYK